MAELDVASFKKLLPLDFYEVFLQKQVRPDGRALLEFREASVTPSLLSSSTVGSALVKVGDTCVVAGLKAEVGAPPAGAPDKGILVVNVELPPLCSPDAEPGRPSRTTQVLTQHLNHVLLGPSSGASLDALAIVPGQAAWVLYLDVIAIDDSGSLDDAAVLAAVAALSSFSLPHVDVEDDGQVVADPDKEPTRLTLASLRNTPTLPLSFTFGILGSHLIADPTASELALLSAQLKLVLDGYTGNVLSTVKTGSSPWSPAQLSTCIEVAKQRADTIVSNFLS